MRLCAAQLAPIETPSGSDPYKKYVVELHPPDSAHPRCSCIAWAVARNRARKGLGVVNSDVPGKCKHLAAALLATCTWTGDETVCPDCGGPTVEDGTPAPPVVPTAPQPTPTVGMRELRPMLAEEVNADLLPRYIADDRYWMQAKADGHRVLIHVLNGSVTVLGRGGQTSQHSARFNQPAYRDILRLDGCVVDGELVGDTLWLFDLPAMAYDITPDTPYRQRQAALEALFAQWQPNPAYYRLLSTAKTGLEKAQLAVNLLKANAEGVMLKHVDGVYLAGGRSKDTLKAKYVRDADLIVSAVGAKGHDSYSLSVFRHGELVEVGACSSIGKETCSIGDVISARFLYIGANGRLYQPRMLSKRLDKKPEECTWEVQLAHAGVNKNVLS